MTDTVVAEKMTQRAAIRKAIEELGIDGDTNLILARAQELAQRTFDNKHPTQPVYQAKMEMRKESKGEPKKAIKRPAKVEKISKVTKAPRRKSAASFVSSQSQAEGKTESSSDVVASIHAVRECIEKVGSKETVMAILAALS